MRPCQGRRVRGKEEEEERGRINTPALPDTLAVPTQHPLSALCLTRTRTNPASLSLGKASLPITLAKIPKLFSDR